MKQYEFQINEFELDTFFPKKRIKRKTDILDILLETCRFMLIHKAEAKVHSENKIVLHVDKMSRLFYYTNNKYYSIFFPFYVNENSGNLNFNFRDLFEIDAKSISILLSVLKDENFESESSIDFVEPIYDLEYSFNNYLWIVLKNLLLAEDGYIRYDVDRKGYLKAKNENKEHVHPEHHYDVFYNNQTAIKFGLYRNFISKEFQDCLNPTFDCLYLESFK